MLTAPGNRSVAWAAGRWLVERRLVLVSGLLAALPIIFSVIHAVSAGWVALGDDAAVALRSYDVLTDRSPLLGLPSTGPTGVLDEQTYHPGPLLFWLLALPAHFMAPSTLIVTVGLVNVASVMGVVALARRRGGLPLMFAVAVAVPLMLTSVSTEAYSDVWNPAAALLPFLLLIFVSWSLACGDYRLLPLAVLLASFATQCHLAYLLPSLGALGVGVLGLAASRRRTRGRPELAADGGVRRWLVAALVVAIACWSAPLVDLAANDPANLVLLGEAATADQATLGLDVGLRALVFAVGVPPWWLSDPRVAIERVADLIDTPDSALIATAVLVLGALAAVTLAGWRRRRHDVAAAGALALVLCVALVQFASSVPEESFTNLGYGLWWASPAGMFVWLALGWSLATLFVPARRRVHPRLFALLGLAGLATVLATAVFVAVGADWRAEPFELMSDINERLDAELPARPTRVDALSGEGAFLALGLQTGIVSSLRRNGRDDVTAPAIASSLGSSYRDGGAAPEQVVRVDVNSTPPENGRVILHRRVVEEADPADPSPRDSPPRIVTVTVAPVDAGR